MRPLNLPRLELSGEQNQNNQYIIFRNKSIQNKNKKISSKKYKTRRKNKIKIKTKTKRRNNGFFNIF